jgi:plasmid maintenance system antidote protein VapI
MAKSIRVHGKWSGQTKSEFEKNYKRIKDIVDKSSGDEAKAISLAKTQANRITDEHKAINRAMAAKSMGEEFIFEAFFQRAYELGMVSKQDYRDYRLSKLGI